ncbi:MAG: M15 family metallopeptidase [Deltaproteobacteria bacterium]
MAPFPTTLISASLLGLAMGAMLGGSALGVVEAATMPPVAVAVPRVTPSVAPAFAMMADEGDPGDWDDAIDFDGAGDAEGDLEGDGLEPPPSPGHPRPARASTRNALDSAFYRVQPGPVTGYRDGHAFTCTVTLVDGKPVEVRTASAFERMRAMAARAGLALRVISGFRTMEHQRALYAAFRARRGNLAALPGHSNHQSGHALDLNVTTPGVLRWLDQHARDFGFRRTVPTESWHWEHW